MKKANLTVVIVAVIVAGLGLCGNRTSADPNAVVTDFTGKPRVNLSGSCPLIKYIYTADASAIVENGRVYVFMSHDKNNATKYTMDDVACISSSDMKNWRFEGMIYNHTQTTENLIWAPTVVKRNNTFYMYYGTGYSGNIGVASAPNILGPYTYKGILYHDTSRKYTDPSVFIDDDSQAYIYYNGRVTIKYAKLSADMISLQTTPVDLPNSRFPDFIEGPTIVKIHGKYNLTWSEGRGSRKYNLLQNVSSSPDRDFKTSSMFMGEPTCNNQSSIISFAGTNYSTYHNSNRTGSGFRRDVGICYVKLNTNGTMDPVTATTAEVAQISYLNPYITQRANEISDCNGIDFDPNAAVGDQYVVASTGSWVKVSGVDFSTAPASVEISAASPNSGQTVQVRLDSPTGTIIATINVANTGSWFTFGTFLATISRGPTGVHDVYFYYSGGLNHKTYKFNNLTGNLSAKVP